MTDFQAGVLVLLAIIAANTCATCNRVDGPAGRTAPTERVKPVRIYKPQDG